MIIELKLSVSIIHQINAKILHHIIIKNILIKHWQERYPYTFSNIVTFNGTDFFLLYIINIFFLWRCRSFLFRKTLEVRIFDLIGINRKLYTTNINRYHFLINNAYYFAFLI